MLGEELLGKTLGIVQQVQRGEIEGMRGVFLAFLALDLVHGLGVGLFLLLGLLVDGDLVLDLGEVDLLVAALVLELLALLVAAEEEAHSADDDLFVVRETSLLHDVDGLGLSPDLTLPHLAGDFDGPDGARGGAVRRHQVVEDGLDGAVERVVDGPRVGVAQVAEDLGEEQRAERLGGRGDEDWEERLEDRGRVDDVLAAQEQQAADNLLAQLRVQDGVVLCQDGLKVAGEAAHDVRVAVGNVCHEVDHVVEGFDRVGRGGGWGGEEDVALGLVLLPLL